MEPVRVHNAAEYEKIIGGRGKDVKFKQMSVRKALPVLYEATCFYCQENLKGLKDSDIVLISTFPGMFNCIERHVAAQIIKP
jgi:hypothetical protein